MISFAFVEITYFSTLGVPTVEEVYGGRINFINGYKIHADSTRIVVTTESANTAFYADMYTANGTTSVQKFKVIPSLNNTANFGSRISSIQIHELSESIYFIDNNNELYGTNFTDSSANNTGVTGVNEVIIKGNHIFAAGSGQMHFGTLDASNNFTAGSSISFPNFSDLFKIVIHPTTKKMYAFSKGNTPELYVSSDDYDAFSSSTTFTDISPTLTSTGVNWTAFGIAPDGRFFIIGSGNSGKYVAYSDNSGTSYTEYDSGISGVSSFNIDFSGNATKYHVYSASMMNDNNGVSGAWSKIGKTSHYTHPNDGAVYVDANNSDIMYSTSDQGLGISFDKGSTVVSADEGIEAVQVNDMEMTQDKTTGWIASKSGIRKVTNYTTTPTWTTAIFPNGDGSGYSSIAMKPTNHNTAYAGNVRVYKTTDSGANWTKVFTPENAPYNFPGVGTVAEALTICPFDENIVFAGFSVRDSDKGGLFVSEDAGSTWSQVLLHASSTGNDVDVNDIVFTQESGSIVAYVGVDYDLSTPTGRSIYRVEQTSSGWTVTQDMNSGTTSTGTTIVVTIKDLDFNVNTNTVYATGTDAGTNHPVTYYKPLGGSNLWTVNTSSGFPTSGAGGNKQGKAIVHDGKNTLYCAVENEIYYLVDGTSSWTLGYTYPNGTRINCLFYDELLVGTDTGLYAQADPSNQTASVDDFSPYTFSTYPNPINKGNSLTVSYNLEVEKPTFRITNLSGQLIKEYRVNEVINGGNNSSKIMLPTNIRNGMYLLSIYNKKQKLTTKKIIVK